MKDRYVAAIAIAILSVGLLISHDQPVRTSIRPRYWQPG
jgi:hypothetical protein